jgi:hypothetical protein
MDSRPPGLFGVIHSGHGCSLSADKLIERSRSLNPTQPVNGIREPCRGATALRLGALSIEREIVAAKTPVVAIHHDRHRGLAAYLAGFRVVDHHSHMPITRAGPSRQAADAKIKEADVAHPPASSLPRAVTLRDLAGPAASSSSPALTGGAFLVPRGWCCCLELRRDRLCWPVNCTKSREAELKLLKLSILGVMLLGGAGCMWDHGHDRGGADRGAPSYSGQRSDDRGDMRNQGGGRHYEQNRQDDRR